MATSPFRIQVTFKPHEIQHILAKVGVGELADFDVAEFPKLDPSAQTRIRGLIGDSVRRYVATTLERGCSPIPDLLSDDNPEPCFVDIAARRKPIGDEPDAIAPALVLSLRFGTPIGEPVPLTPAQLVETTVDLYKKRGANCGFKEVVHSAVRSYCQGVIGRDMAADYTPGSRGFRTDVAHLKLAHRLVQASLAGQTEIVVVDPETGASNTIPVPAWSRNDGREIYYGLRDRYITDHAIVTACARSPIGIQVHPKTIRRWVTENGIEGVFPTVSAAKAAAKKLKESVD